MSSSAMPPLVLTEQEKQVFEDRVWTTGDAFFKYRQVPEVVPSELDRLHTESKKACFEYLLRLLDIYAFEGKPRLPYIAFMDYQIYADAQEELNKRLEANGKKPQSSLPPEKSLLPALRQAAIEGANIRPAGFFGYSSADGECQWKPERNAAWMYKFLCGPKLCRYQHGETCPHGFVFSKGRAPQGWKDGVGWTNGNPYQGAYTGPTSGCPSAAALSSTGADSSFGSSVGASSTRANSDEDPDEEVETGDMEVDEMDIDG